MVVTSRCFAFRVLITQAAQDFATGKNFSLINALNESFAFFLWKVIL